MLHSDMVKHYATCRHMQVNKNITDTLDTDGMML